MEWSTCPPDILAKCFKSQQDYKDNSAAACVCTSWHDTFRNCAEQIEIQQNPLNEALLSPTYLKQFTSLQKVELGLGPEWPDQHSTSGHWLWAGAPKPRWEDVPRWTETMQSIPTSCYLLKLDGFFPYVQNSLGAINHLTNLRSLHIHSHQWRNVFLKDFANLKQMQSLSLVGRQSSGITIHGSLHGLPVGITNLQLNFCQQVASEAQFFCLQHMSHLPELTSIDMSFCCVSFGEGSEVAELHRIKVLVLDCARARDSESVVASLMTATQLQDLNLRKFKLDSVGLPVVQLGGLLTSLKSLQKLDVTGCDHVYLGPSEYTQLRLHSFACHYSQLNIVDTVPFKAFSQPFQTREGITIWPSLQVEGQFPHFGYQHWIETLPTTALTHLTIQNAHVWPLPLLLDSKGQALPNLVYLDISFASLVSTCLYISFPVGFKVRELYIAGASYDTVDLAECTSLTSLGIIHKGHELPSLVALPTSLERLCLHNVWKADIYPELGLLSNLEYLKLGGRAGSNGIMNRLPELSPSLLELDLWDGVVTKLDQLTLLSRLKKLRMPSPPTPQQLSIIKRLRQLRHIVVTTHEGMRKLLRLPKTFAGCTCECHPLFVFYS